MAIWRADRNGADQILLASLPNEPLGSPRWTPDGKSIIFDGGRIGTSSLYTVSAEGGIQQRCLVTASSSSLQSPRREVGVLHQLVHGPA